MSGNIKPRQYEKERFGEVFTPPTIINAMLDQLPPEVWLDPAKKWLDPAAGFGNFFIEVYTRLVKSLECVIPDTSTRHRHIIREMLYMVEYNPESCVRIRENSFFANGVNLFCGSFLDLAVSTTVPASFAEGVVSFEFDIIVGNPPFNADQSHEGKKGGGSNLWPKFVEKALQAAPVSLLKHNGFLVFIHPALWRKPPSTKPTVKTLFNLMVHENHMKYLEIHSKLDGLRDFGVQTRYDFYVIQKRVPNTTTRPAIDTTILKDQTGVIDSSFDLSRWRFFLPNHGYERIEQLLLIPDHDAAATAPRVIFSRCQYGSDQSWVSPTPNEIYRFPVIHSTPKKGVRILWSSRCHIATATDDGYIPMFGVPKVIFGESGINNVILDIDGKYGMTQGAIGLKIPDPIDREGPAMKKALESEKFHQILDAMSFSNFRIDWRMFLHFRPDFYRDELFGGSQKFQRPGRGRGKQ